MTVFVGATAFEAQIGPIYMRILTFGYDQLMRQRDITAGKTYYGGKPNKDGRQYFRKVHAYDPDNGQVCVTGHHLPQRVSRLWMTRKAFARWATGVVPEIGTRGIYFLADNLKARVVGHGADVLLIKTDDGAEYAISVQSLMPERRQVMLAKPFVHGKMGSLGDANCMLLRQHDFPLDYEVGTDIICSADDDRIRSWHGHDFYHDCRKKYSDNQWFENWIMVADPKKILNFLIEVMKMEFHNGKKVTWTGFRILGTINVSNGYPVYSFQLFSRGSEETKVYSGMNAPNVDRPKRTAAFQDMYGRTYYNDEYEGWSNVGR